MKKTLAAIICFSILIISGCTPGASVSSATGDGKLNIVASLFPQYDFARQITADLAHITLLLPPGADSHEFEPTPSDIINIYNADVFLYTGEAMEHWAHSIIDSLPSDSNLLIVDVSEGISLLSSESGEHKGIDPHIWTSPINAETMTRTILGALCRADSPNTEKYTQNAEKYIANLQALDNNLRTITRSAKNNTIYFGSRFSLRYFCEEYGIVAVSAYDNCGEETEPSAKDIAFLIDSMQQSNTKVVYCQELESPQICSAIAEDTGAETLLFHSCHNLSKEDFDNGATYLGLMTNNADNLQKGLN